MGRLNVTSFILSCWWLGALQTAPPETKVPTRLIAIAPNTAEVVCALGACDAIVGVSKFCVYPPELKNRPFVGGLSDPDLERIATLRPDLILMRGRVDSLERLVQRMNIQIYRDETDTLDGIKRCVSEMGLLLERQEAAAKINERFDQELQSIRDRVAGNPPPRVLLTASRDPDRIANLLTVGQGSFLSEMLEIAGGTNIFGDVEMAYPQVSPEAIVARQPEVIIELMPEAALSTEAEQRLRSQWEQHGSIPAAKSKRIYFVTLDHCLIPSPRYPQVIAHVAQLIHPAANTNP